MKFVKVGANTYVIRKMRKAQYKLQKLYLVSLFVMRKNENGTF